MSAYLGVDVGTYETKGVVVSERGEILASAVRPHELSVPRAGWAEHDAESVWWEDVRSVMQELLARPEVKAQEIAAVGCSAIGPCVVPVDTDGRALRPGILYGIDTRATEEIAWLEQRLGAEAVFERGGNALTTQSVGPKLLWLRRHEPQHFHDAARFHTSTSFLVAKLTGEHVMDHYTAAGYSPLYDVHEQAWSPEFARDVVDVERLPELRWSHEIAGTVTPDAARATGLPEGTPVITGTVDAAAEAVSAGVVGPGQMMVMYGTTAFMIEVVAEPLTTPQLWYAPFVFPGTHALLAGMGTTGALTRWIRDQFARELVAAEASTGEAAYGTLTREAEAAPPGSDGLVCLPYFSGERTPIQDPHARGVFFGLTLAHERGHLYRAALEGIGFGIRHHLDVLAEVGGVPEQLVAVGGGTKSPLWLQIVSDVTGRVQDVPEVTVGASYGDAFLAHLACHPELDDRAIHDWVAWDAPIRPSPERTEAYQQPYGVYRELYERTKDLMREVGRTGDA